MKFKLASSRVTRDWNRRRERNSLVRHADFPLFGLLVSANFHATKDQRRYLVRPAYHGTGDLVLIDQVLALNTNSLDDGKLVAVFVTVGFDNEGVAIFMVEAPVAGL